MKNFKKILISLGVVSSITIPFTLSLHSLNSSQNEINLKQETHSNTLSSNAIVSNRQFSIENSGLQTISSNIGPIVIDATNKAKIINYDWYYNSAWEVDVSTNEFDNSTSIADWEYLPDKDFLFLITDKAVLVKIQASTGKVLASINRANSGIQPGSNKISKIDFNSTLYVWNSRESNGQISSIDANTLKVSKASIGTQKNSTLDILGLDVGYNLAITTTDPITSNGNNNIPNVTNIKLQFVDDSINEFNTTGTNTNQPISITIDSTPYNKIYRNIFKRNANTFLLVIANKFYEITLNKQDMSKSTIAEKTTSGTTNTANTFKVFSSSFMTQNGSIFLKSNSDPKIYRIAPNSNDVVTFLDLSTVTDSTNPELKKAASTNDDALIIYPVPISPNNNSSNYLDSSVFIMDSKSNLSTGINNGTFMYNFESSKPTVDYPATSAASFLSKIPSSISSKDFASINADRLEDSNVWLEADDLTGKLKAKFKITKTAWYSNSLKTISIINKEFQVSKIYDPTNTSQSKFNYASQTSFENIDNGYFKKKSPSQLTSSDFDKYGASVLTLSNSVSLDFLKNLKRTFIVTNRVDSTGEIKVKAIVSYTNVYGNYVSFVANEQQYTVTKTTANSYAFKFTDNNSPTLNTLKQTLPSLIDNRNTSLLENFIAEETLYPPSRRNILLTANDVKGELNVVVVYNGLAPDVKAFFEHTFTGFVTEQDATVKFNGNSINSQTKPDLASIFKDAKDITTIQGYSGYDKKIVNEINISELSLTYDFSVLAKMNFVPKVTIAPLQTKELEYGALTVEVSFDPKDHTTGKQLPELYKDKFGLKDYKIKQQYVGFLSVGVLYTISLKNYESMAIQNLVSTVPIGSVVQSSKLLNTLNLKGFTSNEVVIKNYSWKNESIVFEVTAQSSQYPSINKRLTFTIDWAPFFQSSRTTNLIIGVAVALLGTILVAVAIAFYIYRKNKIRRMLK